MEWHWIQAFPTFCPRDWSWEVRDSEVGQRFRSVGRGSDLPWPHIHQSTVDMSIISSQASRSKQVVAIFSFHSCAQNPIRSIIFRCIQVNLVNPLTVLGCTELCEVCLGFSIFLRRRVQFFLFPRFIKLSEGSVLTSEKSRKPLPYMAGDEFWDVGKSSFYSFCDHPNLLDLLFK